MSTSQDLKSAGLKATLPRLKIINLFEESKVRHLTAEDVYKLLLNEGLDIGLATVYRVLTQFEQAGLLVRHHFESGKAVFELNQGTHHDHLVCMQCGRVEEFYDAEIEKRQIKIARERGFEIKRARALPVRRLHEAQVPAPPQVGGPCLALALAPVEIGQPESQQIERREVTGGARHDDAREAPDARPRPGVQP